MDHVLERLRAAAEPTRLRLLALCAESELTVSDLTQILGQSQPRVSRHLKLLCDAGLLERFREGTWAFFRLAQQGEGAETARWLVEQLTVDDPVLGLDRTRLGAIRTSRAESAARYFDSAASDWGRIRSLHVDDSIVEQAILQKVGIDSIRDYLDIGTGTGRLLEVIGPHVERGVGIDLSREMLAVARANLERAGLKNCSVRQADLYQLPLATESFDAVTLHQVLHYLDNPALAIIEATRTLRPGGRLLVVDFAPHDLEELREQHAHRRLGFSEAEVAEWCRSAGLIPGEAVHLTGGRLTVTIWAAARPAPAATRRDAA
ncbi:ArsR/SmtB family transcription factor [Lacibacterium aquatile]|uniref:ArsR/SmtB family transcription factor n=1 Tax=Lacibacterium aquatile TaxID=1168082 RepID=A0ABW5DY32_9PROT